MPINDRNLKPGTKLVARYHKQTHTCEVVEVEGKLKYRLVDGREFKSPSGAGMAVTGHACDGWTFWSVETAQAAPATEETAQTLAEAPVTPPATTDVTPVETALAAEEPGPAKKRIFRLPNQKGAPEGKVRWYCHDCGKGFLAEPGENPETCPQGHKAA